MSLHRSFAKLFSETVTLAPRVSAGTGYGDVAYGTPKPWKARIEMERRKVEDGAGRLVDSRGRVFLMPTPVDGSDTKPKEDDQLTLPAGYEPQQPPIQGIDRAGDESGIHHWVLYL